MGFLDRLRPPEKVLASKKAKLNREIKLEEDAIEVEKLQEKLDRLKKREPEPTKPVGRPKKVA